MYPCSLISLHRALCGYPRIPSIFRQTAKTLISLHIRVFAVGICSLVGNAICSGSFYLLCSGKHCLGIILARLFYTSNIAYKYMEKKNFYSRPRGYKNFFSCSTQLSMKFSLLINMKTSAVFSKKEFAIISNLRFISRTNFMLSWVEHEKSSITLGPDQITSDSLGIISSHKCTHSVRFELCQLPTKFETTVVSVCSCCITPSLFHDLSLLTKAHRATVL